MTKANYSLRLQPSLKTAAEKFALTEGTSLNQFINVAVAENRQHSIPKAFSKTARRMPVVMIFWRFWMGRGERCLWMGIGFEERVGIGARG
jgi:hypothetical protein